MRFGAVMNGPDHVQWHGVYEQLIDLTELRERDGEIRAKGKVITNTTQDTSKSTKEETR